MGRPIKKTFFGNLNRENHGSVFQGSGVGGEGVTSVNVSNTGSLYSLGTTVSFTAPQIAGGKTATGHPTFAAFGTGKYGITGIVIDDSGSGYTSAPTISVTTATSVHADSTGNSGVTATNTFTVASVTGIQIGMLISGASTGVSGRVTQIDSTNKIITTTVANSGNWTDASNLYFYDFGTGFANSVALTTTVTNAIAFDSYLTTGSSAVSKGDIVKQESSRRYLVNNSQGEGQCRLVSTCTLTAGTMNIVATDWNGSTYYVKKLTARKAVLAQSTASTAFLILDGASTGWTLGAATGTVVTISQTN